MTLEPGQRRLYRPTPGLRPFRRVQPGLKLPQQRAPTPLLDPSGGAPLLPLADGPPNQALPRPPRSRAHPAPAPTPLRGTTSVTAGTPLGFVGLVTICDRSLN